jgi:hypothetical protein
VTQSDGDQLRRRVASSGCTALLHAVSAPNRVLAPLASLPVASRRSSSSGSVDGGCACIASVAAAGDPAYTAHVPLAIEQVLAALEAESVRYLVVGGVAVVLHGHLRTTADLDLVVQLAPENARRAIAALAALGFRPRAPVPAEQFADAQVRQSWMDEKDLTVFSLWSDRLPELEVDLFVKEPFPFDEVYARAVRVPLDTTTATVVSLEDLIALKRAAGRPIDLADVEALRAIAAGEWGGP